jgi:hypothetical protein
MAEDSGAKLLRKHVPLAVVEERDASTGSL